VRESEARGTPIPWRRVNQLPDHVYFNHSAHINHGIGCATCHGNVSEMPLIRKTNAFFMSECLSCHQNPDPYLRPKSEIFNEDFHGNAALGAQLRKEYRIHPERLIQCSVCHR
jgi:NAD-dependent SIR2 family protein deacetylase